MDPVGGVRRRRPPGSANIMDICLNVLGRLTQGVIHQEKAFGLLYCDDFVIFAPSEHPAHTQLRLRA